MNNIASDDPHFHSELVRENLNAMHNAREAYIHQEASARLSRALNRQTRTYSDKEFVNGDDVFYKREASSRWQGPAKVLGKDSNQVLIKHGSSYLRVHPCRLLHKRENFGGGQSTSMQIQPAAEGDQAEAPNTRFDYYSDCDEEYGRPSKTTNSSPVQPPVAPSGTTADELSTSSIQHDAPPETPDDNLPEPQQITAGDIPTTTTDHTSRSVCKEVPKKHQQFTYRLSGETEDRTATCLGRAGKASTASWHYVNIHDHDSDSERCISIRDHVESWTPVSDVLTANK